MPIKGFLGSGTYSSKIPLTLAPACGACGLLKKCQSPKMPVYGKGSKGVMIVGEAPGRTEDERNKPFVGQSGQLLREDLDELGIDLKRDCWVTNSLICRPPGNKTPDDKKIGFCRPNLLNAIKEYKPRVIILLGGIAVKSLIGYLWKEDPKGINRWVGFQIPCMRFDSWVCPTYHPSHLLRNEKISRGPDVARMFFRKHLESAFNLEGTPWNGEPPDYSRQVVTCFDHQRAAVFIRQFGERREPIAFDYETDRLKPDSKNSKILCCAISNGSTSVAFPWVGDAAKEAEELLRSDVPKICHSVKFEARWTRRVLGFWLKNLFWDTMLGAHVLDNRPEITGLKFQAFVKLGQESHDYDAAVKPYMAAAGSNLPNRLKDFDRGMMLRYCGLDALLTYKLYQIQKKEFKCEKREQ